MSSIVHTVRCIAVNFGGTLARRDHEVDGSAIVAALAECTRWGVPESFAEALDRAMEDAHASDRTSLHQTPFVEIMHDAAARAGCDLPDDELWSERVFEHLPDAHIDTAAAQAVHDLAKCGVKIVLASNTRWPVAARYRTLQNAGIGDAFNALVLSSAIGVRKPHPEFYRTVLARADCRASEVLFVGDTEDKDVEPPRRFGMQSLRVAPIGASESYTSQSDLPYFAELPTLLKAAFR